MTHLALKAAFLPGSSGSGVLKLGKHQGKQAWTATVTVQPPPQPKRKPPKPQWISRRPQPAQEPTATDPGSPARSAQDAAAPAPATDPPAPVAQEEPEPLPPLELLFILPRLLMNVSGPAITAFASLPVVDASAAKPPQSAWSSTFTPSAPPKTPFLPSPPPPYSILTLQDDLDLPSFTTKVQRGGSPRGHNGVRSLTTALGGSRDFWRIRLGVGRPPDAGKKSKSDRGDVSGWVMGPLGGDEVRACEWEEGQEGGRVLNEVWREIMRIGWLEEGQELEVPKK